MRITEINAMQWAQQRAEGLATAPRVQPVSAITALNALDGDRDGWIDEDDLPYDQLMLLERQRAKAAKQARERADAPASAAPVAPPPAAPAAPVTPAKHVDVTLGDAPAAAPLVDLRA